MTSTFTIQIKEAFTKLGHYLKSYSDDGLRQLVSTSHHYNAWFTPEQTEKAVKSLGVMLSEKDLTYWLSKEGLEERHQEQMNHGSGGKTVGLVLAGNIPLVGLHDILCVIASGHHALIKLSSHDKYLTPYVLKKLTEFEPLLESQIAYTERLEKYDAVIATGSNNTSRYFEYYFQRVPHIIRKNRNSVAILYGDEKDEDLQALGHDIFDYFGLGCRNVSKIYIPQEYDLAVFFRGIESFKGVLQHHKYANNYDYNKSIYLVNREPHLDNGFLLLKETKGTADGRSTANLSSPLATLYYERYAQVESLGSELARFSDEIQCIVTNRPLALSNQQVSFGECQHPRLWDYADGINTMQFLLSI